MQSFLIKILFTFVSVSAMVDLVTEVQEGATVEVGMEALHILALAAVVEVVGILDLVEDVATVEEEVEEEGEFSLCFILLYF